MENYFDFTGKKIFVTGASSGIGRSTAILLSKQGATLVITGRNQDRLEETYNQLEGTGHIKIVADLYQEEDLKNIFDQIVADNKKLNGVVHCAGTVITAPISTLKKQDFVDMMSLNIYTLLDIVKFFSKKKYNENGGNIVAVSSVAAVNPGKCQTIYAAAKAGMNGAIQAVAQELAAKNIRINSVMPGFTKTQMYYDTIAYLGEEAVKKVTDTQLLGVPEPEEIANAIMFLLSDASSTITGRAMYTDSGTL